MFTYKYLRPTKKEKGHTKVYNKGNFIGYFLPNRSTFSAEYENYNFVSKCKELPNMHAKNRTELIEMIETQYNNAQNT